MPINLQGSGNIAEGWGPAPQLHAANISGVLGEILQQRRYQQALMQKNISDTIKNIQSQRQGDAYAEALRNAGLTQGQDISGLSAADATRLATLIQAQTPDTDVDALHQAQKAYYDARTADINDPDDTEEPLDPAEQRRQDAEKRKEVSEKVKALKAQMKLSEMPEDAVPHALAPGETTQPGMYPFDVGGKRQDIPHSRVDQFEAARRAYDVLTKQQAQVPGPSSAGGGSPSGQYPPGTHARRGDVWYKKIIPTPGNPSGWEVDSDFNG
jgi:hypothetical protein